MRRVVFGLCGRIVLLAVLLGAAKAHAEPSACATQSEMMMWRRGVMLREKTSPICFPVSMMCWRNRARLGPHSMTCRPVDMGDDV